MDRQDRQCQVTPALASSYFWGGGQRQDPQQAQNEPDHTSSGPGRGRGSGIGIGRSSEGASTLYQLARAGTELIRGGQD